MVSTLPSIHQVYVLLGVTFFCFSSTWEMSTKRDFKRSLKDNRSHAATTAISTLAKCRNAFNNLTPEKMARYVDASGKPGSGLFGGSTLWYGSYSECDKLPDSKYCFTMFPGIMALIPNRTEAYHFEWGVCMPYVCTVDDLRKDFGYFFKTISGISSVMPFTKFVQINCAESPKYTASVVITIIFCCLLVGVCLLATIQEALTPFFPPRSNVAMANDNQISMDKDLNEQTPLLPDVATQTVEERGLSYKILNSFSITRNIKYVMNTKVGKSDLTYLHGIRVISLFWIILLHVNLSSITGLWPYDNLKDRVQYQRQLAPRVMQVGFGVDTFFVLSGLLLMYTNISKKTKNDGYTNWFKHYFHRFWRLTPSVMFFALLVAKLRPFFGAGPVWFVAADTTGCSENWWTVLLYIINFYMESGYKSCLGQTWFLAVDMQFFVFSPLFLWIAYRFKLRPLIGAASLVIAASIIVTACIAAKNDLMPVTLSFSRLNIFFGNNLEEALRSDLDSLYDIYMKPYCRIPPYMMGMVLGYIIFEHFSKRFQLRMKLVLLIWVCAAALALTYIYAPYSAIKENPRIWSKGERAVFWAMKYSCWGLCIVWLIFACQYNYAGFIKNILAAKFWIPLSRINFAAYIVHFDVIGLLIYNIEAPIHYTQFTTVTYYLSALVLTYAVAFILTVMVEMPCANLETLFWKKWENRKSS